MKETKKETIQYDNGYGFTYVNTGTLKAIRLPKNEVNALNRAAGCGDGTLAQARRTLRRVAKSAAMARRQELAKSALPILERITEAEK